MVSTLTKVFWTVKITWSFLTPSVTKVSMQLARKHQTPITPGAKAAAVFQPFEKKIISAAKVLNLSTPTIFFRIIIPFNLPRYINALPIHLATSLMTLTVAEMLGADTGMGYYVRVSLNYANYTKAIAGIIFIGFVVTVLNIAIQKAKKHLVKWNY